MDWHRLSVQETFVQLKSQPEGISSALAQERLQLYGPNELQEGRQKSAALLLLSQFSEVMTLILLFAAVVSAWLGDLTDTIVILIIVLLNALVGFIQEYRAEKALLALRSLAVTQARVLRDGAVTTLPATLLVPGDVVLLEAGNAVPADLRVTESYDLKLEEASLTGESESVQKTTDALQASELPPGDRKNMAFKGTFVAHGRGTAVVTATGMETELGRIAKMLQLDDRRTPLQQRMASFGRRLSILVILVCVIFFVAGWLRGEDLTRMILTSISLAVAAIPEALPAVITISLALAARRMTRYHTLIRKLPAVETLGSVTYICTDKTGTLTRNKMQVEQLFLGGKRYTATDFPVAACDEKAILLLNALALNNDAAKDASGKLRGESTELALR